MWRIGGPRRRGRQVLRLNKDTISKSTAGSHAAAKRALAKCAPEAAGIISRLFRQPLHWVICSQRCMVARLYNGAVFVCGQSSVGVSMPQGFGKRMRVA